MKRLDLLLVELGLAPSRSKAQSLIAAGEVEVQQSNGAWICAAKPSQALPDSVPLRIKSSAQTLKYVSRGGLKLEAALLTLSLPVEGLRCLDVGISTGGFTDCLLQHGAVSVIGIDVGHAQLASALRADPRLKHFEGVNARDLSQNQELLRLIQGEVDLCVVDVSFISLAKIIPQLQPLMRQGTQVLALVKPQFEVGAAHLDSHGIVRDEGLFAEVKVEILRTLEKYGFSVEQYLACALKGSDGNQEFFVHAKRT